MCTVSWLRQADGYVLFCNRDESNTRKPAAGPRLERRDGIVYIAPVDGDHGGSWIGVNQFGLTLCLLNQYTCWNPDPDQKYTSRGLLLTSMLDLETCRQVHSRLLRTDLEQFPPFTLAVLSTSHALMQFDWTGRERLVQVDAETRVPLTSSSLPQPTVTALRRAQFKQMISGAHVVDVALLERFHRSHLPERGPISVCLHREDATTVSMSVVTVGPENIEFVYHPASPCVAATPESVVLKRSDRLT